MATVKTVVPKPQPAKTIGILNIIFGAGLFLCSTFSLVSLLFMPAMQRMMESQQKTAMAKAEEEHTDQIAELKALEEGAESDAEREQYQVKRKELEERGPIMPPGADLMMAGFQGKTTMRWSWLDSTTSILMNVLMITAGAGLVMLKPWGHKLAIWVAGIKVARLLVVWMLWVLVVTPEMSQKLGESVEKMIVQQQAATGGGGAPPPVSFTQIYAVTYSAMGIGMIIFGSIYPIISLFVLTRPGVRAVFQRRAPEAELLG